MYKILDSNQTLTEINVSFSKLPGSCSSLWWDQSEKKNAEKKKCLEREHLAGPVSRVCNTWSQGCGFESHTGYSRPHL